MLNTSRYLVLALVGLAGCGEIPTFPDKLAECLMGPCYSGGPSSEPGFGLSPSDRRIVRGDTVRFVTWRCVGYDFDCYERGSVQSFWSIEGGAAAAAFASDSSTIAGAAAVELIVRGQAAGVARITAVGRNDSTRAFSTTLTVVDSSAITELRLLQTTSSDTASTAMGALLYVHLVDATGNRYSPQSVTWTVSDSTFVLKPASYGFDQPAKFLKPALPGTVVVTATFGGLSRSRQLTFVAP